MNTRPDNNIQPVYFIDGKRLGTVTGIFKHLLNKHPTATSIGSIGPDRTLRVFDSTNGVVATYAATKPEIGKDIVLTRFGDKVTS